MLSTATVQDYVNWIKKALDSGKTPGYYYDYPMPRMALATEDFTMNGECGARSISIIVQKDVSFVGDMGHNTLYLPDGSSRNSFIGFPVYSNTEFMAIPGMQRFRDMELRKQALEEANREAEYARMDMLTSDVRTWSNRNY